MATAQTRVLLHHDPDQTAASQLSALPDSVALTICPPEDVAGLQSALAEAEVVWHVLTPLSAADIEAAPRLRLIQKIGVGVNTIDIDAARRRGVAVCNMPGTNTQAVAEMTLLHMLAGLRRATPVDAAMRREAGWARAAALSAGAGELFGRTVGFLGYGAVPRALTPVLTALGARLLAWARRPVEVPGVRRADLAEILSEADIVSVHLPLAEDTRGLLDDRALAQMKPGALLVNTARGEIVSEPALVRALEEGRIGFAGLDVFATEPPGPGTALRGQPNTLLTPHVAWHTEETWRRSLEVALDNLARLSSGSPLTHQVA